jgi:glycosyltransferase involved in cell wall biosynthesis
MNSSKKPIKIMRIITRMAVGGPSLQVASLSKDLNDYGYETMLIDGALKDDEIDMTYLINTNLYSRNHVDELVAPFDLVSDLKAVIKIFLLALKYKPDIIHTHHAKAGAIGRVAGWLARVPVRIHTFHGHVFRGHFGKRKTEFYRVMEGILSLISTRIIALSDLQRDDLVNTFNVSSSNQTCVVPLGFDLERFVKAIGKRGFLRKKFNFTNSHKLIGIVGRLVPVKNHDLFINSANRILKNRDDIRFVIVGDGEFEERLKKKVEDLNLKEKIVFLPSVKEVELVYSDLDLFVLCSHSEGTPATIIEAMAAKTPVVATSVGGVPDLIKDKISGRLVTPGDEEAMATAMMESVDLPPAKLKQQLKTASEFSLGKYSIQHLVSNLNDLYKECLTEINK